MRYRQFLSFSRRVPLKLAPKLKTTFSQITRKSTTSIFKKNLPAIDFPMTRNLHSKLFLLILKIDAKTLTFEKLTRTITSKNINFFNIENNYEKLYETSVVTFQLQQASARPIFVALNYSHSSLRTNLFQNFLRFQTFHFQTTPFLSQFSPLTFRARVSNFKLNRHDSQNAYRFPSRYIFDRQIPSFSNKFFNLTKYIETTSFQKFLTLPRMSLKSNYQTHITSFMHDNITILPPIYTYTTAITCFWNFRQKTAHASYTNYQKSFYLFPSLKEIANRTLIKWKYCFDEIPGFAPETFENEEWNIQRIRFKPGYSILWRKARSALKNVFQLNFRYQHKLTRYIMSLSRSTNTDNNVISNLTLSLIVDSFFFTAASLAFDSIRKGYVFVNGIVIRNLKFRILKNDNCQLICNLVYYILELRAISDRETIENYWKWQIKKKKLKPQSKNFLKLTKTAYIFNKFRDTEIFLEIDFLSLSAIVITEPFTEFFFQERRTDENQIALRGLRLFNWKYIT